jgi:hypothetical protein
MHPRLRNLLLATTPLLFALESFARHRVGATLAWAALALLGKEDVALVVGALALLALLRPGHGRLGLGLGLAALATTSLVVTLAWLRPTFNHGEVAYAELYRLWGASNGEAFLAMVRQPARVVASLWTTPGESFDTLVKRLELPPAKVPSNLAAQGNTVSSSIPLLFEAFVDNPGVSRILMSGFGVGLSWASCLVERRH